MNPLYPVTLTKADNGWVVTAGCMTLVFGGTNNLKVELNRYLVDPAKVQKEYLDFYRPLGSNQIMTSDTCEPAPDVPQAHPEPRRS